MNDNTDTSPRDKRLDNLREPWKAGESGNPKGRPKGSVSPKAELQKLLNIILKDQVNPLTNLPEDMPAGRKVALNLIVKAMEDGDLNAIKQVFENIDGKPAQAINLGGQEGENPLQVSNKLEVLVVNPKDKERDA